MSKIDQIYLEVDNHLLKDRFEDLLNSNNAKLFVVEDIYNNELIAYSIVQIMHQRNIQLLVPIYLRNWKLSEFI